MVIDTVIDPPRGANFLAGMCSQSTRCIPRIRWRAYGRCSERSAMPI